ncbi:MAG: porin family protein, partial [Alphaproteobacteria bacterium]
MILAWLLLLSGVAAPALAADTGGYAGLTFGPIFTGSETFKAGGDLYKAGTQPGFDVGAHAGYDFGLVRLEAEVGVQSASANDFTLLDDPALGAVLGLSNGDEARLDGRRRALSGMVNGLVDLPSPGPWQVFVGGGVGIAQIKNSNLRVGATPLIGDDRSAFAWQAMGGVRRAIAQDVDFSIRYRYFQAEDRAFADQSLART